MYYVYCRSVMSGRDEFVQIYDDVKDAIKRIGTNYAIDKDCGQLGNYYYFMVQR